MIGAVLLAVACVLLTLALVAWVARRNPDHHRSWHRLTRDQRLWQTERPREPQHE
jgi:uncharacterized membrane protein YozB (DUF420 family)